MAKTHIVHRFDSFGQFITYAEQGADRREGSSQTSGDVTFYGARSFDEAISLAKNGWMEARNEVDNLSTSLVAKLREAMRVGLEFRNSISGPAVDIGLYASGVPTCMVRPFFLDQPGPQRVVPILISTTCSSNIRTETIVKRGIAVTALVELLAKANKAVEIYVEDTVSDNEDLHTILVRVKDANEPLDINRVMFAMGHPAMQRRLTFAAQEAEPMDIRRKFGFVKYGGYSGAGYGRWVASGALAMADELGPDTVKCPALNDNYAWDAQASVKWIIQTLRNCGVTVEEN